MKKPRASQLSEDSLDCSMQVEHHLQRRTSSLMFVTQDSAVEDFLNNGSEPATEVDSLEPNPTSLRSTTRGSSVADQRPLARATRSTAKPAVEVAQTWKDYNKPWHI